MSYSRMNAGSLGVYALGIVLGLALASPAAAVPINYGDFSGATVMYLDVTETSNTPGDVEPLFGDGNPAAPFNPKLVGDKLDFDPGAFTASASGGTVDLTVGQLNFIVMGLGGHAITDLLIKEQGDYNLIGTGTAITQIVYGVSIASINVLEVDGIPLALPVSLAAASTSGSDNLSLGVDVLTPWSLTLHYDVNAALTSASVPHSFGATKLEIVINNSLAAISETSSIAFLAKKDFTVTPTVVLVPEPTTVGVVTLAILTLGARRSRQLS